MTVIIGLEHEGEVWLGADRATVGGWTQDSLAVPKLFRTGSFIAGVTGNLRFLQEVRRLHWPLLGSEVDPALWLAEVAVPTLWSHMKDAQLLNKDKDGEMVMCGEMLLALRGHLYALGTQGSLTRSSYGYYAVGSGRDVALGALHALTRTHNLAPEGIVRSALCAATAHTMGIRPPFDVWRQMDTDYVIERQFLD